VSTLINVVDYPDIDGVIVLVNVTLLMLQLLKLAERVNAL